MPTLIAMVAAGLVAMLVIQLRYELVQNDIKARRKSRQAALKKRERSLKRLKGQLKKKKRKKAAVFSEQLKKKITKKPN